MADWQDPDFICYGHTIKISQAEEDCLQRGKNQSVRKETFVIIAGISV
jgi:hypothetical protein